MNAVIVKAVLLSALLAAGIASAKNDKGNQGNGNGNGGSSGTVTTPASPSANVKATDVALNSSASNAYAYSSVNPGNGSTAGFATAFAATGTGSWSVLEKVEQSGTLTDYSSLLDFSFTNTTGTSGTWTITNTSTTLDATLDLAVAIHASNASTAFLFDNQAIAAGQTVTGSWAITWENNGGNVPGFSNLVLFGRDLSTSAVLTPMQPVPEPGTLAMLLSGFALLGGVAYRRRNAGK
jgi:hypothetical protein